MGLPVIWIQLEVNYIFFSTNLWIDKYEKQWNVSCTRLYSVINTHFFMPPYANSFWLDDSSGWHFLLKKDSDFSAGWEISPVSSCTGDNLFSSEARRSYNFTSAFPLLIASIKFSVWLLWKENKKSICAGEVRKNCDQQSFCTLRNQMLTV